MDKEDYLKTLSEELHRQAYKTYKHSRVIAFHSNDIWSMDLMDMGIKNNQADFRYVLVVVDVFTRYAWVRLLEKKDADTVLAALKTLIIFDDFVTPPNKIWVDQGSEFINAKVKKWLTGLAPPIVMYHTYSQNKSVFAERFIRTLKHKLFTWMTANNTEKWSKAVLDKIVETYNKTIHTSTGYTPDALIKASIEKQREVYDELKQKYEDSSRSDVAGEYDAGRTSRFKVGQWVRISRVKDKFEKGAEINWSPETFKITYTIQPSFKGDPWRYQLRDTYGEPIKGSFYGKELQVSKLEDNYLVEKELKKRMKDGKAQTQVIFVGFPGVKEWVDDENLQNFK